MVETPPAALSIPFIELSANVSLEQLMGSLLAMQWCQLTDGSVRSWWQDNRHGLRDSKVVPMTVLLHGDKNRT